jgi:hypothetical protein
MKNQEWPTPLSSTSNGAACDLLLDTTTTQEESTIGAWSAVSAALLGDLAMTTHEKVTKRLRRKNDKDKPKRPLSAYNIFFKEERERILEELPAYIIKKDWVEKNDVKNKKRKGSKADFKKIDFQCLAKLIGKRWQSLEKGLLEQYKTRAEADLKRYRSEMEMYQTVLAEEEEQEQLLQPTPLPWANTDGAAF